MMQQEFLQPSWPFHKVINSNLDDELGTCDFNFDNDPSDYSWTSNFSSMFSNEMITFPPSDDELQAMMNEFSMELENFEPVVSDKVKDFGTSFDNSEGSLSLVSQVSSPSSSTKSSEASMDSTLTFLGEEMEIDNQLGVLHLLQAYGEAVEKEQSELADVIIRCFSDKASPTGETLERLAYNLSPDFEKKGDYLMQESRKNFVAAFKAFYQIFPYGRFAHFAANSAILESMPDDAEIVHIVDFDMGEGIQWPSMIEAMARQKRTMKLTSVKTQDNDFACVPRQWSFEETRKQLSDYARVSGLKLKVEEMDFEELVWEIKRKKKGCGKEWLVFNCIVELPHMGRSRSRKHVIEFLQVAKEMLCRSRGIVTLGDGDACEKLIGSTGFGSFFEGYMEHYQAVLESIKTSFPTQLAEARMAMECLFVAPYVSSHGWLQKWEEIRQGYHLQAGFGLEECEVSKNFLMEAKELMKGERSYEVTNGGHSKNEIILEWRGTPLVRVSAWRS